MLAADVYRTACASHKVRIDFLQPMKIDSAFGFIKYVFCNLQLVLNIKWVLIRNLQTVKANQRDRHQWVSKRAGKMQKPVNCTAPELAKVNVDLIDFIDVQLQCQRCQKVWKPAREHGRLSPTYWRCPDGCNLKNTGNPVHSWPL